MGVIPFSAIFRKYVKIWFQTKCISQHFFKERGKKIKTNARSLPNSKLPEVNVGYILYTRWDLHNRGQLFHTFLNHPTSRTAHFPGISLMGSIPLRAFGSSKIYLDRAPQNMKNAATRRSPIATNLEKSAAECQKQARALCDREKHGALHWPDFSYIQYKL